MLLNLLAIRILLLLGREVVNFTLLNHGIFLEVLDIAETNNFTMEDHKMYRSSLQDQYDYVLYGYKLKMRNQMSKNLRTTQYQSLKNQIGELLRKGREQAGRAVNAVLVQTYWHIGRHIVEFEQGGKKKSAYGSELLERLSHDLTLLYGRGFSRSNLIYMRKFFLSFPKSETLSHQLSWSHYFEILKAESDLEISFYAKQCEKERWSVRELKRQMKSMLFHRLALSKDKEGVLAIANKGVDIQRQKTSLKTPMFLNFWTYHSNTSILKAR